MCLYVSVCIRVGVLVCECVGLWVGVGVEYTCVCARMFACLCAHVRVCVHVYIWIHVVNYLV